MNWINNVVTKMERDQLRKPYTWLMKRGTIPAMHVKSLLAFKKQYYKSRGVKFRFV